MHLDQEQVQRVVHGEVAPGAAAEVDRHLSECADCRSRVTSARADEADILLRLSRLDHPAPAVGIEDIIARARPREASGWRRAAGMLLAAAVAGAAYAAPGSPFPGLVERAMSWIAGPSTGAAPLAGDVIDRAGEGIAVAAGNALTIVLQREQPGDTLVVSLTDDAMLSVRAAGGRASFSSSEERLVIDNREPGGRITILVPRDAPHVEILLREHRLFLKRGSRIATTGVADSGRHFIPLSVRR